MGWCEEVGGQAEQGGRCSVGNAEALALGRVDLIILLVDTLE